MSRGFGALQRLILGVIDRATREEEAGPCLPYELFCDAQGAEYHPARVVRVGWVCQSLAVNVNKYRIWEDGLRWGQAQTPTFKAAFSRAMRHSKRWGSR